MAFAVLPSAFPALPPFPFALSSFHTYAAEGADVHRIITGILQAHDATYKVKADGHKAGIANYAMVSFLCYMSLSSPPYFTLQYSVVIWKTEGFLRCSIRMYNHGSAGTNQVLVAIRKRRGSGGFLGRLYVQLDTHLKAPWLPLFAQPLSVAIPDTVLEGQERLTPAEAEVSLAHTLDMLTSNSSAPVLEAAITLGRLLATDYAAAAITSLRDIGLAVCQILPSTLYVDCKIAAAQVLVLYGKQSAGWANVGAISTDWPIWTWMLDILQAPASSVDAIQLQRSVYVR
jgi:hypothetical protein